MANPRSSKAKGHRLEKWIKEKILETFPELTDDDVRSTISSETGADIKLSRKARQVFFFDVEAKNRQTFTTLYNFYAQADGHGDANPLLIIKMNHKKPLAIIDAELLFQLVKDYKFGT